MSEPTYPLKELIVQAIAAKLATIKVAAGYHVDVTAVVRPRRTGELFNPKALGVAVIQGPEERSPGDDAVGNPPAIGWRLAIDCCLVIRLSESSDTPMDRALNLFEADVRKALMADSQWGGLALNTELGGTEYPLPTAGIEGVTVSLFVNYRVAENDPYVQV